MAYKAEAKIGRSPEQRIDVHPTLVLVSGASAVGKTTMAGSGCDYLGRVGIKARRPVAYTTREPRPYEVDGVDYNFVGKEAFNTRFAPQIRAGNGDWDVDTIGGSVYFNRFSDTIPTPDCPVSILPVSSELCPEMVDRYASSFPQLKICVISLEVNAGNHAAWRARLVEARPGREAESELEQRMMIPSSGVVHYSPMVPEWRMDYDRARFQYIVGEEVFSRVR